MWMTAKKLRRDKRIFGLIMFANFGFMALVWVKKEIEYLLPFVLTFAAFIWGSRALTRCAGCDHSVIWWWLTKAHARESLDTFLKSPTCPACGFGTDSGEVAATKN